MPFTHNYYTVLGLAPPTSEAVLTQEALRKAYKAALLRCHPDKSPPSLSTPTTAAPAATKDVPYTIDDIREALAVLSDGARRGAFERWLSAQSRTQAHGGEGGGGAWGGAGEDVLLGLEALDLSDFEAGPAPFVRMETPSPPQEVELDFEDLRPVELGGEGGEGVAGEGVGEDGHEVEEGEGEEEEEREEGPGREGEMEWTRGCRCGAQRGFRIREGELEEAEARGEKEVLVGCEGCSLWVRVGFDVEEG